MEAIQLFGTPNEILTEVLNYNSTSSLPISLLYFKGKSANKHVLLEWKTAAEINNDYFTLERSIKGLEWEAINTVNGSQNSSVFINYSSIDKNPHLGTSYYRLKQTDLNGQFSYSNILSMYVENNNIFTYPNPSKNELNIVGSKWEIEHLKLFNYLGQDITYQTHIKENHGSRIVLDFTS